MGVAEVVFTDDGNDRSGEAYYAVRDAAYLARKNGDTALAFRLEWVADSIGSGIIRDGA